MVAILPVTPGQRKVIGYIEHNLGIKFDGDTMHEARFWISKHMKDSKEVRQEEVSFEEELADIAAESMFDPWNIL